MCTQNRSKMLQAYPPLPLTEVQISVLLNRRQIFLLLLTQNLDGQSMGLTLLVHPSIAKQSRSCHESLESFGMLVSKNVSKSRRPRQGIYALKAKYPIIRRGSVRFRSIPFDEFLKRHQNCLKQRSAKKYDAAVFLLNSFYGICPVRFLFDLLRHFLRVWFDFGLTF